MKKLLIVMLTVLFMSAVSFAEISRNGNTFKVEQTDSIDKVTPYTWIDRDGKVYPIYISKNKKCYIKKISKEGKPYKKYLPKNIQEQIKKELGYETDKHPNT